jgi:hypothetical protein
MSINYSNMPSVSTRTATPIDILRGGNYQQVPGGITLDGRECRDIFNTSYVNTLQAGTLIHRVDTAYTSGVDSASVPVGVYTTSLVGIVNGAYEAGTSLTVTAASVTEIVRRIGATGTFYIVGTATPSTSVNENGAAGSELVTYSAASGTTVTITALGRDYPVGALLLHTSCVRRSAYSSDLLQLSDCFLVPDRFGIRMTDIDGNNINKYCNPYVEAQYDTSKIQCFSLLNSFDTRWLQAELSDNKNIQFTL